MPASIDRRGPLEPARVVRGVLASVHFYVFVRAFYRVGRPSSLDGLEACPVEESLEPVSDDAAGVDDEF